MNTLTKDIVICTANPGKIKEFKQIIELNPDIKVNFKAIADMVEDFDPEETGTSFLENSLIKAQAGAKLTSSYCIADDSGVEISALDKKPGIYSKRYLAAKENGVLDVLEELKDAKDRSCRYVCSIVLVDAQGNKIFETQNYWEGEVGFKAQGSNGFGFDPIVHPNENPDLTVAQLEPQEKSRLSHRAKAMAQLVNFLKNMDIV